MKYASKWNRLWLLFAGVAILSSTPTIAHHGWSWAFDEQTTLQGTIQEISMAPPHPALRVAEANGTLWQVDLGNPNQTARSGFTAQSAKPGDAVAVLGNRHRDEGVKQMKAVRITVGATNYDMYPERIRAK
jgi:uncharacterized protein DUF6152